MDVRDIQNLRALLNTSDPEELRKNLTAATGFLGINLEDTAKLMLPLFAGVRNSIPVDVPRVGAASAQWRMQLGYGSYGFGANMGTAFGGNGADTTPAATTIAALYKSQSIHGEVQWEAIQQARGWDDALRIETSIALASLIKSDELLVVGGNIDALAAPVGTGASATLAAPGTFAVGVWSFFITAITEQGAQTNAAANSNVGESAVSARVDVTIATSAKAFIDLSWPAVPGAVGYKIYGNSAVGGGNTAFLINPNLGLSYRKITAGVTDLSLLGDPIVVPAGQTFVGVNHVQVTAAPLGTQPVPPGADGSASTLQFDGLINWAQKTTLYGTSGLSHIANVDMNGAPLTTSGAGVLEIDNVLQSLWTNYIISPTKILTSPKGVVSLSNKVIAANNGSMYRLEMQAERGKLVGGVFIGGYINKFAASLTNQRANVDVWAHPYIPDGTFIFLSEDVPYQYAQTGRSFGLDVQTPYTYWELGRTSRTIPFDVFFTETLKCYFPLAQAAIQGARVDA